MAKINFHILDKTFSVFSLSGEESLYKPFCFDLEFLIFEKDYTQSWLFETAELYLPEKTITGIITEEEIIHTQQDNLLKIICNLEPKFVILKHQFLASTYLNKNLKTILEDKINFQTIQWQADIPPNKPYIFQVPQESDQCFLKRLFSHEKYFYYFDNNNIITKNKNTENCIAIKHTASQPTGPQGEGQTIPYHFVKEFLSTPADFFWPIEPEPLIPLILTGHIQSQSQYADIDESGNYKNNNLYADTMPWLARLTPHEHLHFPLRDQAEVLLAYLYGESHHPVIIGSAHNHEQKSPVTTENFTQHILKSQSGNLFCADDLLTQQQWTIQNPNKQNYLNLNMTNQTLTLSSEGQILFNAEANINSYSKQNTHVSVGEQFSQAIDHQFSSVTQTGNMTYEVQQNFMMQSKNNSIINTQETMLLKSQQKLTMSSTKSLHILSSMQNFEGNIVLDSTQNINLIGSGKGSILFSAGSTSIELTQNGNINLTAPQITLTGQPLFSVMPS